MNLKKIVIVGNSVALRNRPHVKEQSKNYGQLIQKSLNEGKSDEIIQVENIAFGRATMRDLHIVQDRVINTFGDLYVINIGVSDAATREMPRWFADKLNQRKQTFGVKVAKGIEATFVRPMRSFLVKLRGKRSWTSKKKFNQLFTELVYRIQHNTSGKVIVLSMSPPDDRVEKSVPGTAKKYKEYNEVLKDICKNKEIEYLNLDELTPEPHYPDGTHYSEVGNAAVAELLLKRIEEKKMI